jgi:amino acid transporter
LSLVLEFAALVALRLREPDLPRPYRVPGGMIGAILIGVGPTALLCLAFFKSLSQAGARVAIIVSVISMVAGVVLYFVAVWINPRASGKVIEQRGFEVVMRDDKGIRK